MRIIGIDPGNRESAMALYNGESFQFGKFDNFGEFFPQLEKWLIENRVDEVYIEGIQAMGMSVGASVFETAYFIGEIKMWLGMKFPHIARVIIHRSDVKMHHCNSMRAKDTNIRQAIIDRFGAPGTKRNPGILYGCSGDMWSAVAIATMAYDHLNKQHP